MPSEHLNPKLVEQFSWQDSLSRDDYVLVHYEIETCFDPVLAACSMAQEQSVGANVGDILGRPTDLGSALARVVSVEHHGQSSQPLLPFYLLNESVGGTLSRSDGKYNCAAVCIAYPLANIGTSLTQLWNTVYGELPRHGILNAFRVVDIEMPVGFINCFPGPRYGASGLCRTFGIDNRPFFCRSAQPPVGLSIELVEEINDVVLRGGFDLVKDDELTADADLSAYEKRVTRLARHVKRVARETGEQKGYFANIIASPVQGLERLRIAESAGTGGVLVAAGLQGFEFIADVRRRTQLPILAHNAGEDFLSRHPKLGVHPAVLIKCARLAGADMVVFPGTAATPWQDDEEIQRCVAACTEPLADFPRALPILCGAKRSEHLAAYRDLIGSADFMLIVATALNEHPDGIGAGARAFRTSWESIAPSQREKEMLAR